MSSAAASAAALKKDLLSLALKHSPDGSLPVDAMRRVLDATTLVHATEHMRYLMVKDARMPGGFAELDHTSSNGSKLKGEAGELSRDLQVTSFSDSRLLNGLTEIEATVRLGKCELHFKFRRQPKAHGTSMPRHGWSILGYSNTSGWIDLDEGEGGEDEQEEEEIHTATLPSVKKNPTTIVEYTISATNITTPATPRNIVLQVLLYGFHPSGTPSPAGVIDPFKDKNDGREEGGAQEQKDVCTVEMCDVTLEHAIEWSGTALSTADFLSFLFLFPYHEEEWDIGNLALDQLLDADEGSEGEKEDDEEECDFDYESEREEWGPPPSPPPKSASKMKEQVKREHEESKESTGGKQGKGAKKRKT